MYFCWTMYYIQIIQIKTKIVDSLNNWRCIKYLAKRIQVLRVCIQTPTQCLLIPGIHEKFGGILTLIMMILLEHTPRVNACFSSYIFYTIFYSNHFTQNVLYSLNAFYWKNGTLYCRNDILYWKTGTLYCRNDILYCKKGTLYWIICPQYYTWGA